MARCSAACKAAHAAQHEPWLVSVASACCPCLSCAPDGAACAACALVGNAEEAQRLYLEARASSPQAERTLPLHHAALAACCTAIRASPARHTQLVSERRLSAVNAAIMDL